MNNKTKAFILIIILVLVLLPLIIIIANNKERKVKAVQKLEIIKQLPEKEVNTKPDDIQNNNSKVEVKEDLPTSQNKLDLYGDANVDGVVNGKDLITIRKYISGDIKLTEQEFKNADLNNDGVVDNKDLELIRLTLVGANEVETPKETVISQVLYGDVNEDGVINGKDLIRMRKYLEASEKLTDQGFKNADINNDSTVNDQDLELLRKYLAGTYEF